MQRVCYKLFNVIDAFYLTKNKGLISITIRLSKDMTHTKNMTENTPLHKCKFSNPTTISNCFDLLHYLVGEISFKRL